MPLNVHIIPKFQGDPGRDFTSSAETPINAAKEAKQYAEKLGVGAATYRISLTRLSEIFAEFETEGNAGAGYEFKPIAITAEQIQRNSEFEGLKFTPENFEQSESRLHSRRLMEFAKATLRIMSSYKEWDADTTDEISTAAIELGLADCDGPDGHFRVKETPAS